MIEFGKVLWFGGYNRKTDSENDYGFIETNEGTSYFVHKSAILQGNTLREGEWVEFTPQNRIVKGKEKKDARNVKVVTPRPDFPMGKLLLSGQFALVEAVLTQVIMQENATQLAGKWFSQWLDFHSSNDPNCEESYFTTDEVNQDFLHRLAELIKDTVWENYPLKWGMKFYQKVPTFVVDEESEGRIENVNGWLNQQSIDSLQEIWYQFPEWLWKWSSLLNRLNDWLLQIPFREQKNYRSSIPDDIKEQLNLWYLLEGEKFHTAFSKYWSSIENDKNLREKALNQWLQCLTEGDFEKGWTFPLTGKLEKWALMRYKLKLYTPKNWDMDTLNGNYYLRMSGRNPIQVNVPINRIWNGLPASFFEVLSIKVRNKEVDLEIPIEAWALYLRNSEPTGRAIAWLRKKWSLIHQAQKLTIFCLLGEKWFSIQQLYPDLGSVEALLLWEDTINLSVKSSWWDQLDVIGKCSWYIIAFQKGYKNVDFLEGNVTDPLLKSFQLLYKHYLGLQQLDFDQWQSLLQDYYIKLAKNFDKKSLKSSNWLWAACEHEECDFCEGKPWKKGKEDTNQISRAYCPRTKQECLLATTEQEIGARFRSYNRLPGHWLNWRIPEIFSFLKIQIPLNDYFTRFGGWLNRLLELQERLKCSGCKEPMINNFKYSRDFRARYSMTIATCHKHTPGHHDNKIYFNDCWNRHDCNQMIDSRDNRIRDMKDRTINPGLGTYRNYYLCTGCGAAKSPKYYPGYIENFGVTKEKWDFANMQNHFKDWYYVPGDICPNCGSENMKRFSKGNEQNNTHAKCNHCTHTIRIPKIFIPIVELWEQHKRKG
ncbi:cold shock domain-containing protein [Bacillus cereus]|uniref:cold-shock protein n=1 Tax=Bacillus cereus TaxID=1396 RepID=UPI0028532BFD|nr:cold shock domain-containing protein [Bacillus cereus]MDR4985656.1 cold shock domain-containing protein [Bacillus cereus]